MIIFIQILFTLIMYLIGIFLLGLAIFPAILLLVQIATHVSQFNFFLQLLIYSFGLAAAYFLFGFILMILVSIARLIMGLHLREGEHGIGSLEMIKWMLVNALFLLVRITFMDFLLLTPFCALFYKMMGAKLGKGVQINSKNVADLSLLEIGDYSVIGGNATVIGHSFEKKGLVLRKTTIGQGVIIGLNSVIMPGATIGDKVVVAAGAIVPKDAVIAAGTVYYGIQKA